MKTIIKILLLTAFLGFSSCSGNSDDDLNKEKKLTDNKAPLPVSKLIFPNNNMLCTDNELEFKWEKAEDPNNDELTYTLEVATDIEFKDVEVFNTDLTSKKITLKKDQIYYWRVSAKDPFNLTGPYSEVSKFYTEGFGETNHLPFMPDLIFPQNNEHIDKLIVKLDWAGKDVDNDNLTYDVYLDTENPPTAIIKSNISKSFLEVNINNATTYYWRVVVKDGNGGEAIGSVWIFVTK